LNLLTAIQEFEMKKLLIGITLIAGASLASAENSKTNGFSYDYIQGTYNLSSIEETIDDSIVAADFKGYNLSVSKTLTENIFVTAAYASVSTSSVKVDGTTFAISGTGTSTAFGVGYRMPINDKTDLSVDVQSVRVATKGTLSGVEVISDTTTTTPVTATLRFMVIPDFEIQTSLGYSDGDSVYAIGGGFAINKQFNVLGGYAKVTNGTATTIGLRYNF
jgi:hypothetical protein